MHPDGRGGEERFHLSHVVWRVCEIQKRIGGSLSTHLDAMHRWNSDQTSAKHFQKCTVFTVSLEKSDFNRFVLGNTRNDICRLLHPAHLGGSGTIPGGAHKNSSKVKHFWARERAACRTERPVVRFLHKAAQKWHFAIFFVVVRSFTADSNLLQPTEGVSCTPHTSHFLVDSHLMTRTCVAQVWRAHRTFHVISCVIFMRSCCVFDSLRFIHFLLFAVFLLFYRPVFPPGHQLLLPRCGGQMMWWTNSLCNSANEDFGTLAEYVPSIEALENARKKLEVPITEAMPCKIREERTRKLVALLMLPRQHKHASWKPTNPQENVWNELFTKIMKTTLQGKVSINLSTTILCSSLFLWPTKNSKIQWPSCTPRWHCKLLEIRKSECPDFWIRLPKHKWAKSWSSMEDPVVPLQRNLYGHPLAGLLWERQFEKVLLKHGWEKVSNCECLFVHLGKGLFLSVYVDDKNWLEGNKTSTQCGKNLWNKSNWEIQHHSLTMLIWVALNENAKRTMILWTLNPGSLQELKESYLVQGNLTQTSLFMVLWYGRPFEEMFGTILWVGKQDDSTTLQSIYSMQRWPLLQRGRNKICRRIVKNMLSNCSEMLVLSTNWKTWYSMVSKKTCTIDY